MPKRSAGEVYFCDICNKRLNSRQGLSAHNAFEPHRNRELHAAETAQRIPHRQISAANGIAELSSERPSENHLLQSEDQLDLPDTSLDLPSEPLQDADASTGLLEGFEDDVEPDQVAELRSVDLSGPAPQFQGVQPGAQKLGAHLVHRRKHKSSQLPASIAPLPPLLTNLSGADRDLTLKVVTHRNFSPQDIPWKSSTELHKFLDDNQVQRVGMCC